MATAPSSTKKKWPRPPATNAAIKSVVLATFTRQPRTSGAVAFSGMSRARHAPTLLPQAVAKALSRSDTLDDPPVQKVNRALGEARVVLVVGDDADGRAVAVQLFQQLHHGFAIL